MVKPALEYCYLQDVDATNLTFTYKYSVVSAASNHRVNVRVG